MKKLMIALLSAILFSGCALLTPYSITFTTPAHSAVNPLTDTLDLALSQPAMAYVSEVDCAGHDPITLLPVVNEAMSISNVHNLSLELMDGYEATTECDVTVTAFDQSTTSTSAATISLYVLEKPAEVVEYAEQITACEDAGGAWNECGSSCDEGDEFCVQVCVPQCEFSPEENTEENLPDAVEENTPTEEPVLENEAAVTQESCVSDGGQWNVSCDENGDCNSWCEVSLDE